MKKSKPKDALSKDDNSKEMTPEVAKVIKGLPPKEQKEIIRALSIRKQYSGPLPDGDTIRIYSEVIPNGGDRLMTNVETQLEHRITIEKEGVKRSFNQSSTGQWFGFIIALVFGIIAWDLARSGNQITATILGTVDIVALVTVFITGKRSNK